MEVTKTVDNPTADAGDIVTYTLTIKHASDTGADAFNVDLSDLVPVGVTYVAGSLAYVPSSDSNSLAPTPTTLSYDPVGNTIHASYDSFNTKQFSVLTFQGRVVDDIRPFRP